MKTNLLFTILSLLIFSGRNEAQQSLVWKKNLPNEGVYRQVQTDNQNNVYSVIDVLKMGAYNNLARRIYKSNSSGDTLWSVVTENHISDMATDNSGNLYLAGNIRFGSAYKCKVMKINATGTVVWDNLYLDTEYSFDNIEDIEVDLTNNSIYIAVRDYDLNGLNATSKAHIFTLAKIDNSGALLWKYNYSGPIKAESLDYRKVMVDANGNAFIVCNVNVNATYPAITHAVHAAKFNPAGVKLWDTIMRGPQVFPYYLMRSINCTQALLDANNDLFIIGDTAMACKYSKISGVNGAILYTKRIPINNEAYKLIKGTSTPYVVMTKNDGTSKIYGFTALGDTVVKKVGIKTNTPYTMNILMDTKLINSKIYLNFSLYNPNPPQIYLNEVVRIDETSFQEDWNLVYEKPTGSTNYLWADATDHVYVMRDTFATGYSKSITEKHNSNIKNLVGLRELSKANNFKIYPNPVADQFQIDINDSQKITELKIYNSQLQEQKAELMNDAIDVSTLPQGVYFVRFLHAGQNYSGKFIKN